MFLLGFQPFISDLQGKMCTVLHQGTTFMQLANCFLIEVKICTIGGNFLLVCNPGQNPMAYI